MFRLDGKTALVTGASQGIGRAIALAIANHGARVIVAARNRDKLTSVADEITSQGGDATVLALDVSAADSIDEQLKALDDEWAAVDILVNNAGITRDGLLARMKLDDWQSVLDTNLTGAFALTRALLRGMMRQRWGRLIFVSSVVGMMGNVGQANYAASKAGLIGFAKSVARELGSRSVTANVVAPGYIETAMTEALGDDAKSKMSEAIVLRRLGTPEDIAAAVVYLASQEAGYVTGEVLNVSGGLYI
ncbi:MAG: 3-oxoacyl-[acyl-carrier-protein] reductase [Acidobacteriota bacterium]